MNFENIKNWKDLAKKFNFREEDFIKEFEDDITSGSFAVGGMAYGGPHGFLLMNIVQKHFSLIIIISIVK